MVSADLVDLAAVVVAVVVCSLGRGPLAVPVRRVAQERQASLSSNGWSNTWRGSFVSFLLSLVLLTSSFPRASRN